VQAGAERAIEPVLPFEALPCQWFDGETHPATVERPSTVVEDIVLTRLGLQLCCRDHPRAGTWQVEPAGAQICSGCWSPRGTR
jgi:hypothetical protein